jgi:hypothetical protein
MPRKDVRKSHQQDLPLLRRSPSRIRITSAARATFSPKSGAKSTPLPGRRQRRRDRRRDRCPLPSNLSLRPSPETWTRPSRTTAARRRQQQRAATASPARRYLLLRLPRPPSRTAALPPGAEAGPLPLRRGPRARRRSDRCRLPPTQPHRRRRWRLPWRKRRNLPADQSTARPLPAGPRRLPSNTSFPRLGRPRPRPVAPPARALRRPRARRRPRFRRLPWSTNRRRPPWSTNRRRPPRIPLRLRR